MSKSGEVGRRVVGEDKMYCDEVCTCDIKDCNRHEVRGTGLCYKHLEEKGEDKDGNQGRRRRGSVRENITREI